MRLGAGSPIQAQYALTPLNYTLHILWNVGGSLSEFEFARAVEQAGTELLEGPVDSEFFEVSIKTVGPGQKVFSAVHTSRAKMSLQLLKRTRPHSL
jgi:hypothetical protein